MTVALHPEDRVEVDLNLDHDVRLHAAFFMAVREEHVEVEVLEEIVILPAYCKRREQRRGGERQPPELDYAPPASVLRRIHMHAEGDQDVVKHVPPAGKGEHAHRDRVRGRVFAVCVSRGVTTSQEIKQH